MPNARLLAADSLIELRTRPERLTNEIAAFLDEVWGKQPVPAKRSPKRRAKSTRAGARRASAKPA
jgi:hypothetical protein